MVKVFSDNDLDGHGCVLVLQHYYKDVDTTYTNPNAINAKINKFIDSGQYKEYDYIFITDVSVNKKLANRINDLNINVVLLDHHETAIKLNKFDWCHVVIDNGEDLECGTSLVYNYLINEKQFEPNKNLETFVRTIQLYDTWMWKDKYNVEYPYDLSLLFNIYGGKEFNDIYLERLSNNFELFTQFEKQLIEIEKKRINRYVNSKLSQINKIELKLKGKNYLVGLCFSDKYNDILGHEICNNNSNLDFSMMVSNMNSISFRTDKSNIDLAKISKIFGGGGHASAAGCQIKKISKNKIIEYLLFDKEVKL